MTETDDLAQALDEASRRWPDLSRSQLVVHLALQGHQADRLAAQTLRRQRLDAIQRHSGTLTDVYEPGYLEDLRADWPE